MTTGHKHSFAEMVENEKGYGPLLGTTVSNKIRRDLFHGVTVGIDERTSEYYGGSYALVNQVCAQMEEWGFKFERPLSQDGKRKGFKLVNRDHVPVERVRRVRPSRGPRRETPVASTNGLSAPGKHSGVRGKIREALLDGDALSAKEARARFGGAENNLRNTVRTMEREGYHFDEYQGPTGKTFVLQRSRKPSSGMRKQSNDRLPVLHGSRAVQTVMGTNGFAPDIPPLPTFGGHVQVVGQFLAEDGTVSMVMRNDEGTWLTTVEGGGGHPDD